MENGTIKQLQPLLPAKDEPATLVLELSDNLDVYNTYTELKLSFKEGRDAATATAAAIAENTEEAESQSDVGAADTAQEDDLRAQTLAQEAEVDAQLASQGISGSAGTGTHR